MFTWMSGRWIGVGAAICVLLLFLFPLVNGSFQATHGPTTAFRARRAFLVLIFSIIHAAMWVAAQVRYPLAVARLAFLSSNEPAPKLHGSGAEAAILRC
jgi:hypothetical protein